MAHEEIIEFAGAPAMIEEAPASYTGFSPRRKAQNGVDFELRQSGGAMEIWIPVANCDGGWAFSGITVPEMVQGSEQDPDMLTSAELAGVIVSAVSQYSYWPI